MRKKKYWNGSMDPDTIAAIIAEEMPIHVKLTLNTFCHHTLDIIFTKVKDSIQVVEFGLFQPMFSLTFVCVQKCGVN